MTPYEELGMTPDQLLAEGGRIIRTLMFRNEPYEHYVYVVCDPLEYVAVAHYAKAHLGHDPMHNYQRYRQVAGQCINWQYLNNTHTMLCLNIAGLRNYDPVSLLDFIGTLVHEQQHMLTRVERVTGADYRREDEPRTYSTAYTLQQILGILSKNWGVRLIAVPSWMPRRIAMLDVACNVLGARVTPNNIYSGVMQQHMAYSSGVVTPTKDGWQSKTYWSGGEDV